MLETHLQLGATGQHRVLGNHGAVIPDNPRAALAHDLHGLADQHKRHRVAPSMDTSQSSATTRSRAIACRKLTCPVVGAKACASSAKRSIRKLPLKEDSLRMEPSASSRKSDEEVRLRSCRSWRSWVRAGRIAGSRGPPQARHQRGELLPVEEQVRRRSAHELKKIKELEAENARLKRMYAELALENASIKDVLSRKL
jgi:hypothetical protein